MDLNYAFQPLRVDHYGENFYATPGTIELSSSIEKRSPPREKNVTWSWGKNLREERGGHRARPTSRGAPVAGGSPPGGRQLGVGFVGKRLPVCATALSKDYYFNSIIERASQTAHWATNNHTNNNNNNKACFFLYLI